ncbi:MAG: plasmid recombination protein [Lachnospiraceae bacterium]|nr:plasmid recombination protein [Lachnospiraceae bacterium]
MEITKYAASEVLPHIRHDLRDLPDGKNYGNDSIDPSLSKNNYSVINRGSTTVEVNKYRKSLEKDLFKFRRKDLIHAVEAVIQLPDDCPPEQREDFFRECVNFIASTLPRGKQDIFVAKVHRDERHHSPAGEMISKDHIHIMYVPAVKDTKHEGFSYRLCAHELTKRPVLQKLHPNFQAYLNAHGIHATVYHGKNGAGKTLGLSTKQLKEITAKTGVTIDRSMTADDLAALILQNQEYRKEIENLKQQIVELEHQIPAQAAGWGCSPGWGKSIQQEKEITW